MSDSLQLHGLQYTRLPCPPLSLGVCSNSCPLSWWHQQPSHPLLPPSLPALNLSQFQGLSSKSALCIRCPKYWNFNISPCNEYSGLISFRVDWVALLVVQWTLKSLLQHHSLKASIIQCSAFFMVQFSHLYMTAGKTVALTIWQSDVSAFSCAV